MNNIHFQSVSVQDDHHYATQWRCTALDPRLQKRILIRSSVPLTLPETLSPADLNRLREEGVTLSNEFRQL